MGIFSEIGIEDLLRETIGQLDRNARRRDDEREEKLRKKEKNVKKIEDNLRLNAGIPLKKQGEYPSMNDMLISGKVQVKKEKQIAQDSVKEKSESLDEPRSALRDPEIDVPAQPSSSEPKVSAPKQKVQKKQSSPAPSVSAPNRVRVKGKPIAPTNVDTSIVDLLKANGEKSDFASRRAISEGLLGISPSEYKGTAKQNVAMIKAYNERKNKKPDTVGTSVDDGMETNSDLESILNDIMSELQYQEESVTPEDVENGTFKEYITKVVKAATGRDEQTDVEGFREFKRQKALSA